ncbi:MAG: MobF family relaxase, partial [Acidimicrobiales bacterium]
MTGLRSGAGAYYLADLAEELDAGRARGHGARPPDRSDGGPGRWSGRGAAGLGLTGVVGPEDLVAVLEGRHPGTGRPLARQHGTVAGYDLTFAAPKSVSVLFALGSPAVAGAVRDAHDDAAAAALGYVAGHSLAARRGSGEERRLVPVDGPVAATFAHGVSRALDPHLHTHAVVANLAHGIDGRWTAVDGRGLHAHARAAGQVYDAHLRRRLHEGLDIEWTPRRSGAYEVAGIDAALLGVFSNRRAEIQAELGGRRSSRARAVAWASTREEKATVRTPSALRARWRSLAATVVPDGWSRDLGHETRRSGAAWRTRSGVELDEHRFAAALWRTPHAGATRRDAVAAWAGALERGAVVSDVARCVDALAGWGADIGVAERAQPLASLVPGPHLLRALGPRPAEPDRLATWQGAASTLEQYRSRWGVAERGEPLGL